MICTAQLILGCERTHMAKEENCLDGRSQFTLPPGGHAQRMLQVPVHVTNDTNDDSRRSSSSPLPPVCRVIRSILDAVDSPQDTAAAGPSSVAVLIAASA